MKLSDLVKYRNQLREYNTQDVVDIVYREMAPTLHRVQQSGNLTPHDRFIQECYDDIINNIKKFGETIKLAQESVQEKINHHNRDYFAKSYLSYEDLRGAIKDPNHLNRRLHISEQSLNVVSTRVAMRADWHYPGLVIHPGLDTLIDHMVAMDPLYVMDEDWDWLEPLKIRYSVDYQKRVRYFVKQPFSDGAILSAVPDEQLGVILAYNFFNYKPFEVIQKYLEEMYQKLRPGGVVMMTINDCDRPGGVDLVDRYAAAYTPSSLVQGYAEKLGYQVFFRYDLDAAVTWLEFVRPGKLTSLRGGQTLAKTVV